VAERDPPRDEGLLSHAAEPTRELDLIRMKRVERRLLINRDRDEDPVRMLHDARMHDAATLSPARRRAKVEG
jgi:hypothetical protein